MAGAEKVKLGEFKNIPGGRIDARKERETKASGVKPSLKAMHEAGHVFMAFITGTAGVHGADLHERGPIEATTYLTNFSLLVSVGGAAIGDHKGAFGDRMAVDHQGGDWGGALSQARSMMQGNWHVIRALASALEAYKDVGGGDLRAVYDEAKHGADAVIILTLPDGSKKEESLKTEAGSNEIHLPMYIFALLMGAAEAEMEKAKKEAGNVVDFPKPKRRRADILVEADFGEDQVDDLRNAA